MKWKAGYLLNGNEIVFLVTTDPSDSTPETPLQTFSLPTISTFLSTGPHKVVAFVFKGTPRLTAYD